MQFLAVPQERRSFPSYGPDLTGLVRDLCAEVVAERSLAVARHQEILGKLNEQLLLKRLKKRQPSPECSEKPAEQGQCHGAVGIPLDECESEEGGAAQHIATVWNHRALRLDQEIREGRGDIQDQVVRIAGLQKEKGQTPDLTGFAYVSSRVKKCVLHHKFEVLTAGLIFLNAVVMAVEIERNGREIGSKMQYYADSERNGDIWPGSDTAFLCLDWMFGALFVLEAIIKLVGFRCSYFLNGWNLLDFACVVAFTIDKISTLLGITLLDAQTIRLLRLFRLARLVRLIRTLEKLETLYIMTTAIKGMRMVVVWAMALLALVLMSCSLFLTVYLQSTYFENVPDVRNSNSTMPSDLATEKELFKYFGTFCRCMFSMFELTLANWPPVARLLSEEISEWFSLICVFHKLTIGFAVVGVINGVVFQETFQVARTDDVVMVRQKRRGAQAMQQKMRALFQYLDINNDGKLAFSEFMVIAAQKEVRLWLESLDIETDDLLTLFLLLDADGDGTLELGELIVQIPRLCGTARGIDMLAVRKNIPTFQLLRDDSESSGTKHLWAPAAGLSRDKLGAISGTKNAKALDELLKGA